jgi:hypothetical protein
MAKISRNFTAGKMNKTLDERVVPQGEYIDALNIRMGSTEQSEIGVVENTKGNTALTALQFDGVPLSNQARTIGSIADGEQETIYWFVHDPNFPISAEAPLGKIDMIVSFSETTNILNYHIISVNYDNVNTTLNFNPQYLITGVDIIENLLFFTDDYNQPRFFNVRDSYALPIGGLDDSLLWESILVIKRPPTEAPEVELTVLNGQENYLEDRFICFAYRYQYENGEYSAISQFSAPAFAPNDFYFSEQSNLNEGMLSRFNAAIITYNTGGALVKSIDLLFKDMNSNVIKVIEKINKQDLALSDNTLVTYIFSNSKIFTILPESELLRLYDNVPLAAKAQTIMGNRLMYGNYVEGYDLIDKNGNLTMLEYWIKGVSKSENVTNINTTLTSGNYSVNGLVSVPDSIFEVDFTNISLDEGSILNIYLSFIHSSFSGNQYPNETTPLTNLQLSFELPITYNSVFDLVSSIEFQNRVGTILNILPIYDPLGQTSCDGVTWTDEFNCIVPSTLGNTSPIYYKYSSGISVIPQPISTTIVGNVVTFQLPAIRFVDNLTTPTISAYEYYSIVSVTVSLSQSNLNKSLHSNRDYEIGIVYMDEFNRSTTALVSPRNTIHFPCGDSSSQNSIQVIIPSTQVAPAWAKRYKFVIKPDKAGYETIYSNTYFRAVGEPNLWFLLEGENARKVEVGDRYIVKADALGPKSECLYTTVLEKESKSSNFLGTGTQPAGVYMKINSDNIAINENPAITKTQSASDKTDGITPQYVALSLSSYDSTGVPPYTDYSIKNGTIFKISIKSKTTCFVNNTIYSWVYENTFTAATDYNSIEDFFIQQNILSTIALQSQVVFTPSGGASCAVLSNNPPPPVTYDVSTGTIPPNPPNQTSQYFLRLYRDSVNNNLVLFIYGSLYNYNNLIGRSTLTATFWLKDSDGTIIFETLPIDALPDVFYENELSLPIGPNADFPTLQDGAHGGNVQDQNFITGLPAIVDTGFFNCYSFGNGAESYKIRDSIIGRTLEFGNRVTSVAAQDYQEVDRFADITYSGIYNNESNVNKLNEFNLGLLNFKNCESSFGPIYILDGRQTDVLTLQEDKISYVLAGKNLLSDSAAGGAISSVPEVLGTQIARSEKYGISFNPESYVQWGYDRYFTDAKRGAVIQMKGDSYSNDQLKVVSEMGMRTWFRDLFKDSFQTQKLGAFDPYMNEYVLSSNDIAIPQPIDCFNCGIIRTFSFTESETVDFCVDLGLPVGDVNIVYTVQGVALNPFRIDAIYNGGSYTTGNTTSSGILTILKDVNNVRTVSLSVIANGPLILDILVDCVKTQELTIIEVVVTNDYESGKTLHTQYRYNYGTYNSPLQSAFVTFGTQLSNFVISRYNTNVGVVGTGAFPQENSTMRLISNQFASDTFVFKPTMNSFKYLMSTNFYANNTVDITTLLSLASTATPSTTSPNYNDATFTVPPILDYLYLIWDLRDSVATDLCFGTSGLDVCCNCNTCGDENPCKSYTISNASAPFVEVQYVECLEITPTTITVEPNKSVIICMNKDYFPSIISGSADITIYKECEC